jgi:hypothetical protein
MQTLEQKREAARARIAANRAEAQAKAVRDATIAAMKSTGKDLATRVTFGMPMVQAGGKALRHLRGDVYDAANNINGRAGLVQDIDATYDSAMMGGEPFAIWH